MEIKDYKIKIYTRSFSPELYKYSKGLYHTEIESVRLTDQMADGYFYTLLKDMECDIAINIDEDAYVVNWSEILTLVEQVIDGGYANAGTADCAPACPRNCNPIVTNPFFNILNLKVIRTKYKDVKSIKQYDYAQYRDQLLNSLPDWLKTQSKGNYDCYDFEPYYLFFLWCASNFKTLYLPAYRHKDGISTVICGVNSTPLALHSWFARRFRVDSSHTMRIFALIDEAYALNNMVRPEFTQRERRDARVELTYRYIKKAAMRVAAWPSKWRRWLRHLR